MALDPRMSQPAVAGAALSDAPIWARELSQNERRFASTGRTGDVLPDGSVLLRQEDMNRMGLEQLRQWILKIVRHERAIVIAGTDAGHAAHSNRDQRPHLSGVPAG